MSKEVKKGAPACGVYLRIAEDKPLEDANRDIREAAFVINRSSYEKNLHVLELDGESGNAEASQRLLALAEIGKKNGMVVIVRGPAWLASAAEADGVLLAKAEEIVQAREIMGEDGIIGLRCGLSRMTAEKAADMGVDYISFASGGRGDILPQDSLISWWSVKSEVPALVEGKISNDDCGRYVCAGATFVEATDYVWNHPQGIKQGTIDMLYAIDLALQSRSVQ